MKFLYLNTGWSNKNRTLKRKLIFRLLKVKTTVIVLHVKMQSISSVWANFILCIFTRFVKLPISNKNTMLRYNDINCLHRLCHLYAKKNVLLKLVEPSVWLRTARTWTQLITPYMWDSAAEYVSHSISSMDDIKDSAHLLGKSWLTGHWQIYWSSAWRTEGCGSTEWWTNWTVVLTIWFVCYHALV